MSLDLITKNDIIYVIQGTRKVSQETAIRAAIAHLRTSKITSSLVK